MYHSAETNRHAKICSRCRIPNSGLCESELIKSGSTEHWLARSKAEAVATYCPTLRIQILGSFQRDWQATWPNDDRSPPRFPVRFPECSEAPCQITKIRAEPVNVITDLARYENTAMAYGFCSNSRSSSVKKSWPRKGCLSIIRKHRSLTTLRNYRSRIVVRYLGAGVT
jgi:hypothetical protein